MNHHQRKVLHAIFAHPVNANLDLKDVIGMLTALGAEMDAKTKSRIGITLNGQTTVLHLTQHSLLFYCVTTIPGTVVLVALFGSMGNA